MILGVFFALLLIFLVTNQGVFAEVTDKDKKSFVKQPQAKQKPDQKGEKRFILLYDDIVKKSDLDEIEQKGANVKSVFKSIKGVSISADDIKIQQIKLNKKIKVVEDKIFRASLDFSVPQIGANSVYSAGVTGAGVKVCIVDTGVDDTHPNLLPLVAEHDFANNDSDATDDNGHGTHVAGIIASRNSVYRGVAPDASLMAAKVLDNTGSGFMSDVITGIDWCVANGADIINLSLGGDSFITTCDSELDAIAVNNAVDAGVIVAAASGNDGWINAISQPACASKALAVGAIDDIDGRTDFSNEGAELDVVAPGVGIISLRASINGGGVVSLTGTSMATPHVAGEAALLLDTNPSLTAVQVISTIKNTALDLGASGFDTIYGFGRIKAYDAYQNVLSVTAGPPEEYGIAPGDGEITITWTLPELGGVSDSRVTGYKIYRGNPSGFVPIATISGSGPSSHKDGSLTNGSSYCYYMVAMIGSTEGLPTTTKCYTPYSFGPTVSKVEASNFVSNSFGHPANPILVFGTNGQFADYEINVPTTGMYQILIYGENDTPGPVDVQAVLDGTTTQTISFSDNNNEYTEKQAFDANLSSGTHAIQLSFLNDFSESPSSDRNYLHRWVRVVNSTTLPPLPPPTVQYSQAIGQVNIQGTCGLSFPNGNSVNYGSLIPNSISPQVKLNMTNTGTVPATLQVSGSNWLDGSSNSQMLVNRTHYNVTSGTYVQKAPLQSFDQIVTPSFIPAVILQTYWQLQAILMNPSFTGSATQTMAFTTSC